MTINGRVSKWKKIGLLALIALVLFYLLTIVVEAENNLLVALSLLITLGLGSFYCWFRDYRLEPRRARHNRSPEKALQRDNAIMFFRNLFLGKDYDRQQFKLTIISIIVIIVGLALLFATVFLLWPYSNSLLLLALEGVVTFELGILSFRVFDFFREPAVIHRNLNSALKDLESGHK